jgi:hypothetical protein
MPTRSELTRRRDQGDAHLPLAEAAACLLRDWHDVVPNTGQADELFGLN